jgi:hypothetical protein
VRERLGGVGVLVCREKEMRDRLREGKVQVAAGRGEGELWFLSCVWLREKELETIWRRERT